TARSCLPPVREPDGNASTDDHRNSMSQLELPRELLGEERQGRSCPQIRARVRSFAARPGDHRSRRNIPTEPPAWPEALRSEVERQASAARTAAKVRSRAQMR